MSMIERVCETCVYCTFSGNCDRYGRPLTDIEMPACSGYEVHPLLTENAKLRDLIADMSKAFLTLDIDHCQACPRDKASRRCQMFDTTDWECAFVTEMRKLGIEVGS